MAALSSNMHVSLSMGRPATSVRDSRMEWNKTYPKIMSHQRRSSNLPFSFIRYLHATLILNPFALIELFNLINLPHSFTPNRTRLCDKISLGTFEQMITNFYDSEVHASQRCRCVVDVRGRVESSSL